MKLKIIIGGCIIVAGLVLGTISFMDSHIEYGDFADARKIQKKIQVKGEWMKDRESSFSTEKMQFTFFLKDDSGEIVQVVLDGPRPNNFDIAANVVVKGTMTGERFHATEVLTKCPSKYEGQSGAMKK
jgi:cytochrome c-type biogenesis protein CcmE